MSKAKKTILSLLVLVIIAVGFASCASHSCDAYKSSHYYAREILR